MSTLGNVIGTLLLLVSTGWGVDDGVATFLPDAKAGETYAFDAKALEQSVDKRLPMTIEYMYLFEITLQKAWMHIPKDSERISILLDTNVSIVLGPTTKSFLATVDMDSAIDYRAAESSVYLREPNIKDILITGMAPETASQANQMINSALVAYYARYPAYRLSDQEEEGLDFAIDAIVVSDGKVKVRLGEKKTR